MSNYQYRKADKGLYGPVTMGKPTGSSFTTHLFGTPEFQKQSKLWNEHLQALPRVASVPDDCGWKDLEFYSDDKDFRFDLDDDWRYFKVGDTVICTYKDSGLKFWHELLEQELIIAQIVEHANKPHELAFTVDRKEYFYSNSFAKKIAVPLSEESSFYCQNHLEDNGVCTVQCDHCKKYYAPISGGEVKEEALPLNLDKPFPTKDVLAILIRATEYLLQRKNYDGPDYEEMEICVAKGKEILDSLNKGEDEKERGIIISNSDVDVNNGEVRLSDIYFRNEMVDIAEKAFDTAMRNKFSRHPEKVFAKFLNGYLNK